MFNKIPTDDKPQIFTKNIIDDIYILLSETFSSDIENSPYQFFVYGEIFTKELLIIVSLINQESDIDCISCFLSCDQSLTKNKNDIDQVINFYGKLFEDFIETNFENIEYMPEWTESPDPRISYRVSRENISLTLKANKLLEQH